MLLDKNVLTERFSEVDFPDKNGINAVEMVGQKLLLIAGTQ